MRFIYTATFFMSLVMLPLLSYGQGVTTSTITGTVVDTNGDFLPGATILAIHEPSGSEYGVATNVKGNFTIRNMRVGGPYTVRITFVGFEPRVEEGIFLELGERYEIEAVLAEDAAELGELEIVQLHLS